MSKSTLHAYEITYSDLDEDVRTQVGRVMIYENHVRAIHEPERVWQFLTPSVVTPSGEIQSIRATHIGEWEKVKKYVCGWRDAKNLTDLLKAYERWEANLINCSQAWDADDGLPHLTQELQDALTDLGWRRATLLPSGKVTS